MSACYIFTDTAKMKKKFQEGLCEHFNYHNNYYDMLISWGAKFMTHVIAATYVGMDRYVGEAGCCNNGLVCALCLPLSSLHIIDFYEIFYYL